ncbi:uncharacterized protein At4g19900-like [Phoenix dactylifera]|uniref:Uncharacterized protein At4g19900-like n=1 Tax=Phoenix dactylifera TaxID=42345 RepID=A0A8B7BN66_PHODC|nr:uncharacterized protein At4g19900-like [Phoenix dactylifera]
MPTPRRPFSFLLLLLRTSLVALSLLLFLLACNGLGLGLLCLSNDPPFTPLGDPIPMTSSLLVLSEETPILTPRSLHSAHLLHEGGPPSTPPLDPTPKIASLHALSEEISIPKPETDQRSHLLPEKSPPSTPSRNLIPKIFSLPTPREETGLPKSKSLQGSHFLPDSSDGHHPPPQSNFSLPSRKPKWSKRSKLFLRLLRPSARSSLFSARVAEFFRGYRSNSPNSPCKHRFFMTWISSSVAFGPRELFAVESLFKSHQDACLLIVSNTMDSARGEKLLRRFSERAFRVVAVSPDFGYLFRNTPAEPWFNRLLRGEIDPGEVSLGQNLSNLLRLAILYKYGGVYIDTDVIVVRSFGGLRNAIGAQSADADTGNWSRLNNAVMVFDEKHPLVYEFIEEFTRTFDGSKWGHNGPYLVSRVVARVAGRPGFEFRVLPPAAFYPVDWSRIRGLFRGPRDGSHLKWVGAKHKSIHRESFALHLWNRQSRRFTVEEGSVIGRIMSDCCLFCNSSMNAI